jgi:hypothetical protein
MFPKCSHQGHSLELVDVGAARVDAKNWKASEDKGGTPGEKNSVSL